MEEEKILTIKDFYMAVEENPDLRRLGKYKVIPKDESDIIPIDLDLEGQDINLGSGDFRGAFTALCKTKARSLDLGDSVFTDLYMDYLEVESLKFSESKASRLFFDKAKIKNCNFDNFIAPEVYFDWVEIENVFGENLRTGILYLGKLKTTNFDFGAIESNAFRVAMDVGGTDPVELGIEHKATETAHEGTNIADEEVLILNQEEFINKITEDPDLRRLGKYKVVSSTEDNSLIIDLNLEGKNVNFGDGDFSLMDASFGETTAESIDFHNALFTKLGLGGLRSQRLDFSHSQAPFLNFDNSKIGECFFGDFEGYKVHFNESEIRDVFGERGLTESIYFDSLVAGQFNVNNLQAESFNLNSSSVRELYMSSGIGIKKMYFDESKLELLNLHESILKEVNFGNSIITRAMINKSTVDEIHCENLTSDIMFFGNFGRNKIGVLEFGDNKGIKHLELEKILPFESGQEIREAAFDRLSFGKIR